MDASQLKNIVGELREGEVATIRFYGKITEESASRFNNEFDYIESCRPSLIRVLINCEGGSVMHGMSSYATIQNSKIPTECVNEGMAASMGSIRWAAGTRSLMRDYAILMIHNPFLPSAGNWKSDDMVAAFTRQISTIYRKRFGLSGKHVEAIMNGEAGRDGTFFDCESAVKAGIIPPDNILNTTPQLRERVRVELSGLQDAAEIQTMMCRISAEADAPESGFKPSAQAQPTLDQTITKDNEMSEQTKTSPEYSAVAATLGLKDGFEPKDVMARISELISVEGKFKEKEKELSDAQTVIAGKDAAIQNLQTNLSEVTASLKVYQDKEAQEKKTRIEGMVAEAKAEGKIAEADTQKWLEMAEANAELTESILASIPAREQITKEIAADPANVQAAADATKTAEQKIAEKVTAVVGESFEFKKIK